MELREEGQNVSSVVRVIPSCGVRVIKEIRFPAVIYLFRKEKLIYLF